MPSFSRTSQKRLNTCHPDLIRVFNKVIEVRDCSILCGFRTESEQTEAYDHNRSQVKFPDSKHNDMPSSAIDVAPYFLDVKIDWKDYIAFAYFAGYVMHVAEELNVRLRWGGDWDGDLRNRDQTFNDLVHWEILL